MIHIQSLPIADLAGSINGRYINEGELGCWWLGQAGFALRTAETCFIIDPYLSDSLALKYNDTQFKHRRMMPIPVAPQELTSVNSILCTHHHSDHLDPGTLPALLASNPDARLVAPRASLEHLKTMGLHIKLSDSVNPQMELTVGDFKITVLPACHETVEKDQEGNYRFVGYVLETADIRIYHSGDCIPFDGLVDMLRDFDIDLALLPINGRDEMRKSSGVPGNFTVDEAIHLCVDADIDYLLCHHFEMFDFNTIDRDTARQTLEQKAGALGWLLPELNTAYLIKSEHT